MFLENGYMQSTSMHVLFVNELVVTDNSSTVERFVLQKMVTCRAHRCMFTENSSTVKRHPILTGCYTNKRITLCRVVCSLACSMINT